LWLFTSNGDLKQGGTLTADKNLWVFGNFSRFIRPGYKRINIEGADDMTSLLGSAWLSPNENEDLNVRNEGRGVYDLSGRRIGAVANSSLKKGIYIYNGCKIVK